MERQEHKTLLAGGSVVDKTDPRIEFRGRLDKLSALVVSLQIMAQERGLNSLTEKLEEVRSKIYDVLSCEVTGKACEDLSLWGMDSDEIRERSHHPARYFGLGHIRPHHTMGAPAVGLNLLRTEVREAELSACRAFNCQRPDLIAVLNRLSSAIYILIYQYLPSNYDKTIR